MRIHLIVPGLLALVFVACGDTDASTDATTPDDVSDDVDAASDASTDPDAARPDVADEDVDAGADTDATDEPDAGDASDAADAADAEPDLGPIPEDERVWSVALGCWSIEAQSPDGSAAGWLAATSDGEGYTFGASTQDDAARFFLKPSDLATYLLYDEGEHYVVADDAGALVRQAELLSDILTVDDTYLPGAQWVLEGSARDPARMHLRHLKSNTYLTMSGTGGSRAGAALLTLHEAEGCAEHPELSVDATGTPSRTTWDDGTVWGFAEPHTHLMTNYGFGGGGIFHGAPFHPLGVEHALPSCEPFHGAEGRSDLLGFGFGRRSDFNTLLSVLTTGEAPEADHATDGYPTFTDWPNGPDSPTHQVQYYRWLERAWLGGLRLMVQHATSYQVICDMVVGLDIQPVRYSCNDMVAIDRSIAETRRMERYIDAHHGGPGRGWFRIVESPEEARAVIEEGKLAVILGIEVSNLFDCYVTPPPGEARCTEDDIVAALDRYHDLGVRVLFPNHKTDNQFTPGDGSRGVFELANFVLTGHWSNFSMDSCPAEGPGFDRGALQFADLNEPRETFLAPPPNDLSGFASNPLGTVLAYADRAFPARADGDWCQAATLTDDGEFLIRQMMLRGMIIEVDHLPRRSFQRAYELLEAANYPAVGTHGQTNGGRIYGIGGMSVSDFARCSESGRPRDAHRLDRIAQLEAAGMLPTEPFSYDLNGFANPPDGRFSEDNPCREPQEHPVSYPFTSYDGAVTFTAPRVGLRDIDYNVEGLVHIGMFAEMVEDLRGDGVSEASIDALFQSAEAYLQLWERAEARGAALAAGE